MKNELMSHFVKIMLYKITMEDPKGKIENEHG